MWLPGVFGDDEAATHDDEAAKYQLMDTYVFGDFKIAQYDLAVLSHFSYMLFSGGECLVVDPGREVNAVKEARRHKLLIVESARTTGSPEPPREPVKSRSAEGATSPESRPDAREVQSTR